MNGCWEVELLGTGFWDAGVSMLVFEAGVVTVCFPLGLCLVPWSDAGGEVDGVVMVVSAIVTQDSGMTSGHGIGGLCFH